MEFPVPEIGSGGYPDRTIDKRENEYGTMIHSKGDIDVNEKNQIENILVEMEDNEINTEAEKYQKIKEEQLKEQEEYEKKDSDEELNFTNKVNITAAYFLEKTREMCEIINKEGYDYCVNHDCHKTSKNSLGCGAGCTSEGCNCVVTGACKCDHCCGEANVCDHLAHHNTCGLSSSFEKSLESVEKHNYCCSTLVSWALQYAGLVPDKMHEDGVKPVFENLCINYLGGTIIEKGEQLKPGDILFYKDGDDEFSHTDIFGEKVSDGYVKYNGGGYAEVGAKEGEEPTCIEHISGQWEDRMWFAVRLPWKKYKEDNYVGYNGNEAVVSPVTGILLEYGTYSDEIDPISGEEYRVNVDLKYGPLLKKDDESFESETVSDKVGYAKILVLNKEYYNILEQSTNNSWNENKGGSSLLAENGSFKPDILINDATSTANEKLTSIDENIRWPEIDQTVYGYKEFAESYEMAGIAGYIVYIDGFICEYPDIKTDIETSYAYIPYDKRDNARKRATYTMDLETEGISFKSVTESNYERKSLDSNYLEDDKRNLPSKNATDKLLAEIAVKAKASPSMYFSETDSANGEELIFIKEGTTLGRTMTDRELLDAEYLRDGANTENSYKNIRESDEEEDDKVIGNYLRVTMRDLDGTPVENVEDYMKLDPVKNTLGEIEQFMYWQAKEPEGFEFEIDGIKSFALDLSEECVNLGYYQNPARTDNPNDKYGHNYYVDGKYQKGSKGIYNQHDINLCPGICLKEDLEGREIFERVTGKSLAGVEGDCSVYCTGEELLEIYTEMLQHEMDTLRKSFPILENLEDNDTRIFALIDVMYAGAGNFEIGTMANKLRNGDLNLTKEDFLSNATGDNLFYRQNPEGFKRRRLMDYYIYAEGKYGYDLYGGTGDNVPSRYEFISDTPFQDLMMDIEGATLVRMES